MEVIELRYASAPDQVLELFKLPAERRAGLKMGTARVEKGEWVPPEGDSRHAQHEVSLILKGEMELLTAGQRRQVCAGEVVMIPAGQAHRSQANEDTELIWFWFGETDEPAEGGHGEQAYPVDQPGRHG